MSVEAIQQAYQDLTDFIYDHPHMTGVELLRHARKEMQEQWLVLIDNEKAQLGAAFSRANWKRELLFRLDPERFAHGGKHA